MPKDQKIHYVEPVNYQNYGDVDNVTCNDDCTHRNEGDDNDFIEVFHSQS